MKLLDLSLTEIGILIVSVLLMICFLVSGWYLATPAPLLLGILTIEWKRMREAKRHFSKTLPAMAHIVDYHVETRRIHNRYGPDEIYQVWSPVVEFETERGTVKSDYPIFNRDHWFDFDEEYEICYDPEQPEYFYFECRKDERINDAKGGFYAFLFVVAVYAVIVLIFLANR